MSIATILCDSCGQEMLFPETRDDGKCGGCRPNPELFYLDARINVSVFLEDDWDLGPDSFETPEEWQRAVDLVRDIDLRRENWSEWQRLKGQLKESHLDLDFDGTWDFVVLEPKR